MYGFLIRIVHKLERLTSRIDSYEAPSKYRILIIIRVIFRSININASLSLIQGIDYLIKHGYK